MSANIKDFIVITNTENVDSFNTLLGDGSQWGINIDVIPQESPTGIAEAFILAQEHIQDENCILMLGDNIFYGYSRLKQDLQRFEEQSSGCMIYGYEVSDPKRYGVIEFNSKMEVISIEEKPSDPKSNFAAVGLYVLDKEAYSRANMLVPSARGELEITDLMKTYLDEKKLVTKVFKRGVTWLDAGTTESMADATSFVEIIEKRSGVMVACPEEVALNMGFISRVEFDLFIEELPNSRYKEYLLSL
jgi:glucose-1-phosphate thymidylyltransferase